MMAAIGVLEKNDCTEECNSNEECVKSFLIIQSHHDYCFHEEVPEAIAVNMHVYEEICTDAHCDIPAKHDADQRKCPPVECVDEKGEPTDAGDVAFQNMLDSTSNCKKDCSTSDCANNFRMIKTVHDKCPRDTLSTPVEIAYHDLDEACDSFGCNLADADEDENALICMDMASVMGSSSSYMIVPVPFVSYVVNVGVTAIMVTMIHSTLF
jgi:hypothetical protein